MRHCALGLVVLAILKNPWIYSIMVLQNFENHSTSDELSHLIRCKPWYSSPLISVSPLWSSQCCHILKCDSKTMHACMHAHTHTHATHRDIHIQRNIYIHKQKHAHTHIHTHIYIHTHIHTHIYIHTHTHTHPNLFSLVDKCDRLHVKSTWKK
jgi:hypothetical protein